MNNASCPSLMCRRNAQTVRIHETASGRAYPTLLPYPAIWRSPWSRSYWAFGETSVRHGLNTRLSRGRSPHGSVPCADAPMGPIHDRSDCGGVDGAYMAFLHVLSLRLLGLAAADFVFFPGIPLLHSGPQATTPRLAVHKHICTQAQHTYGDDRARLRHTSSWEEWVSRLLRGVTDPRHPLVF